MAKKIQGRVTFDEDYCKGCSLCVHVCPVKIISLNEEAANAKGYHPAHVKAEDMDKCIGCASCALMCPDTVITVERL